MKKSTSSLIAILVFVIFILLLIIIGVSSTQKIAQQYSSTAQSTLNTANRVIDRTGGLNNAVSRVVNNATDTSAPAGSGSTSGSTSVATPSGASVIEINSAAAANQTIVTLGVNGNTAVAVNVSGVNSIPILVGPSTNNKTGGKISIINRSTSGTVAVFTPQSGVQLLGSGSVASGTYVTFNISSPNVFSGDLPINITI